jgi:hypothetical protein
VFIRVMGRFAVTLARLMVRTTDTPLSSVWSLAYWSVVRTAKACVRRRYREASFYVKGSFASREEVYGVSDVDMVVILPSDGSGPGSLQLSARESWKRLCRRFPLFSLVIRHCWFYEEDDLRESLSASCLTYGLASNHDRDRDDRAALLGPLPLADHMGLQTHPGLYGPLSEWRNLGGRERRPAKITDDQQSRRLTAWLDLQYWWRYAFLACAEPDQPHVPLLCVKLLAEPVRLWLWLERGEEVATREEALRRGLSELPAERATLQLGLDLLKALPRSPHPPLPEVIAALSRHTERLAQHMSAAADAAGFVDVQLAGGDDLALTPDARNRMQALRTRGLSGEFLPLADWRARAVPGVPDEALMFIDADAIDPAFIAATALAGDGNAIPAFRYNSILVLPATNPERGMLRAVQSQPTDPVSFALTEGRAVARFPELAGWSAMHCARRAVAEHRGWLAATDWVAPPHGWVGVQSACNHPSLRTMGLLFTAARAALFLESTIEGDPELTLTVAGVAERLVARDPGCRDAVETSLHDFRAARETQGTDQIPVAPMLEVVRELPAYAGSKSFSTAVQ